ncbi:hypothetical protein RO3G_13477 [Rhizopus delemar RA 99-880]|uniref:Yippee domain-containing protein n=1 Tax=Rhizopus delemar (strain RA 99-880 / ATCC MYA-4621 / FGSC 9543 / NRRL 43880) TaxID=246409 RepID=I1CJY6_RHIO9|nr:hypothetical protein RO3G_13477 [Rhizopus delemar RA 99-880]|eukprot:EIE88766.1 hypothetical protein RO3G_13477 [Rhizopus delemar RA 99-880]
MGLTYRAYLEGSSAIFGCCKCETHLSTSNDVISRQFHGQHGQAYLFEHVVNVEYGKAEDRQMSTGLHRVKAYSSDNKYKEGKFVLEKKLLIDLSEKIYMESRTLV